MDVLIMTSNNESSLDSVHFYPNSCHNVNIFYGGGAHED